MSVPVIFSMIELEWRKVGWSAAQSRRLYACGCESGIAAEKLIKSDSPDVEGFVAGANGDGAIELQLPEPGLGIGRELPESARAGVPVNRLLLRRAALERGCRGDVECGFAACGDVFDHDQGPHCTLIRKRAGGDEPLQILYSRIVS